jgi:type VI protein secretion system component VasK
MAGTSAQECWRTTIDDWVQDADIRRHGLLALAMVLTAAVVIVGLASGWLAVLLQVVLPTGLAKTVAGGVVTAGGAGSWVYRRARARRRTPAAAIVRAVRDQQEHTSESAAGA